MSVDATSITQRWERIRDNEDCDLSLSPDSVAWYLSRRESELVRERVLESLIQFADWRLDSDNGDKFVSTDSSGGLQSGDMATCEGLEAFLVPAVESVLPFSEFLAQYEAKGRDKEKFANALNKDITGLLDNWEKGLFPGEPYANTRKIKTSILPLLREDFPNINITESAALACRVLIHLLTLKLNRPDEKLFQKDIGDVLDEERLLRALSNAIDFLIRAFQKGEGANEEEQIANARFGTHIGSGWSWTDREGLPPMLFFTAAAVDAFAELDLYLIRTALKKSLQFTIEAHKLVGFYKDHEDKLLRYQFCVDMARRWVSKVVLPSLIENYGQYAEKFLLGKDAAGEELQYDKAPAGYDQYNDDLAKLEEMQHPPMVFYNTLYALLILLWSWGDRSDDGLEVDEDAKSKINRAISQLIYNYGSIPVVKEILNRFNYVFYLPGKNIFSNEKTGQKEREYLDSAFLPLLTRLLVLFVVYGVGDRNMLEPVIRNLYVELLQSRYRVRINYSALWSAKEIEVFSTQRALQALTFYYAYSRGKEKVETASSGNGNIVLRNNTGLSLILEASLDRPVDIRESLAPAQTVTEHPTEPAKDPDRITDEKFADYCKKIPGYRLARVIDNQKAFDLQGEAKTLGDELMSDYRKGKIHDSGAAKLILNSLADILASPEVGDVVRESDFMLLKKQYDDLISRSAMANN